MSCQSELSLFQHSLVSLHFQGNKQKMINRALQGFREMTYRPTEWILTCKSNHL